MYVVGNFLKEVLELHKRGGLGDGTNFNGIFEQFYAY